MGYFEFKLSQVHKRDTLLTFPPLWAWCKGEPPWKNGRIPALRLLRGAESRRPVSSLGRLAGARRASGMPSMRSLVASVTLGVASHMGGS